MSSTEPGFRCSDEARRRADSPLGTAPRTDRWLLIEHSGPWRPDALAGSRIAPHVLRRLEAAATDRRARVLLIRRPGRPLRSPDGTRAWAVAVGGVGVVWGRWRYDRDLEQAAEALALPWPADGPSADPVLLVCAHGVHDVCCAVRGRPVAAALARRWPQETWECSHVGGDRFAGNLVVLPDGFYYGNLDADHAVSAVQDHLEGRVPVEFLRGDCAHAPPVQAAVGRVHALLGPLGPRDVRVGSVQAPGAGRWTVELQIGSRRLVAEVSAANAPAARLTCQALQTSSARTYDVILTDR